MNRIEEGQYLPEHQHDVEEILLVIAGKCSVSVGDDSAVLGVGDAVIIPPDMDHSVRYDDEAATVVGILASAQARLNTPEQ